MPKNAIDWIATVLVIVGAVNWGLAIFNINLVPLIFRVNVLVNVVYALVGISGLYMIYMLSQEA